jgi:hypothetical protein
MDGIKDDLKWSFVNWLQISSNVFKVWIVMICFKICFNIFLLLWVKAHGMQRVFWQRCGDGFPNGDVGSC